MTVPKLGSVHVPTLLSAVVVLLVVLGLYHLVHKR